MMDALRLLDDAAAARAYAFSPEELKYVLWHVDTAAGTYTPTDTTITTFLTSLRDGLAKIATNPNPTDVEGVVTKTYFDKIFGAGTAIADTSYAIVAGTSGLSEATANAFIDANWTLFLSSTTTAKANLTNSTTQLVGNEARFGYMQPIVQVFLDKRTFATDKVATEFGMTNFVADGVLRTYVHARSIVGGIDSSTMALVLLSGLDAITGTLATAIAPAAYNTYRHLQKVGTILKRLAIKDGDVSWLFPYGPLAFDTLPVVATTVPNAFAHWSRLVAAADLRKDFADGELFDLFETAATGEGTLGAVLFEIANRTGWTVADVTNVATGMSPPLVYPTDFADERGTVRIKQGIDLCKRLALPAEKVVPWRDVIPTQDQATAVKEQIRGTFPPDAWASVAVSARNGLRERQRDALVSYLVPAGNFEDANALGDSALLDVQVMSCAKTSRVKSAISSVQTYLQRVFLNLETINLSTDDARQWEWMKAYRIWEANRKIFLYPENWIEPSLRDDKTPLFKEFETNLAKGELDDDTIEDALVTYLHALDEISFLEVIASAKDYDPDTKVTTLHVVARTRGLPHVYYHRTRTNNREWTAWEKIPHEIQGDQVMLAIYNRRPYLLWGLITVVPLQTLQSLSFPDPLHKRVQVRLRWTSLHKRVWRKVQQSGFALPQGELKILQQNVGFFEKSQSAEEDTRAAARRFALRYAIDTVTNDLLVTVIDSEGGSWASHLVEAFRISGAQGNAYLDPKGGPATDPPDILGPNAIRSGPWFTRNGVNLALPDAYFWWWWQSPSQIQKQPVLTTTPTQYDILVTQGDDLSWIYDPVFFQDATRAFFILPKESAPEATTVDAMVAVSAPAPDSTKHVTKAWSKALSNVSSVADFGATASSTTYTVSLVSSNAVPLTPPTTHTAFKIESFHHPYVRDVMTQLNRYGVDGMMNPQPGKPGSDGLRRQQKSANYFSTYGPTKWVVTPYPVDDFDFSPNGAYSAYNWELFFHIPFMIAQTLATNQKFEEARRWFHYIFNPTEPAAPGATATETAPQRFWKVKPFVSLSAPDIAADSQATTLSLLLSYSDTDPQRVGIRKSLQDQIDDWREHPFEPYRIARLRNVAFMKNVVMKYLDMLIAWGDQLFARATIESINEAAQIYVTALRVLSTRPTKLPPTVVPSLDYDQLGLALGSFAQACLAIESAIPSVNDGVKLSDADDSPLDQKSMYFCVPPNDKLLGYWDTVEDRLFKIRHCLSLEGQTLNLPLFEPPIDPGLLVRARAAGLDIGSILADVTAPPPLVRYSVLSQRATELANEVKSLGAALLSALEKRDAEDLALLRANQEVSLQGAIRVIKQNAIEEAKATIDGLQRALDAAEERRKTYEDRLKPENFMNPAEGEQVDSITFASTTKQHAMETEQIAAAMHLIPDLIIGMGPTPDLKLVLGGSTFASILSVIAAGKNMDAARKDTDGHLAGIQGGYQRRVEDWDLQRKLAEHEKAQIEKQILGAQIRLAIAEADLRNHDLQIENSRDVRDFLRDKYTNIELYEWMIGEISALYFQSYKLAYDTARRAERAWQFELADTKSSFIQFGYWDGLRKGLLAGEKLILDIKRMEIAYLEKNKREYELTRHVPLTQLDPMSLQQLRETGTCQITIPEKLFDSDSPGHYLRRLRNVSLTIAGKTGAYTPVRCTLTLLSSQVRMTANLTDPLVTSNVAIQGVVTSSGRDDGGLFETNMRDERYLPFEGAGAVNSNWELRLPTKLPTFDYRTIADVVLHLRYTAREGGASFRVDVDSALATATWFLGFSVKRVFADAWKQFLGATGAASINIPIDTTKLPFKTPIVTSNPITQLDFIRIRKGTQGSAPALNLTPPGGSAGGLTFTSTGPGGQYIASYGTGANTGTFVLATTSNPPSTYFSADDDFIIIVTYTTV